MLHTKFAAAVAVAVALTACSGASSSTSPSAPPAPTASPTVMPTEVNGTPVASTEAEIGTQVTVTLTDFKVAVDRTSAPAGPVVFNITNAGPSVHELLVLKTDWPLGKIPQDPSEPGKVYEDGHGVVHEGEIGDMVNGASAQLQLYLKPGKYQLVCNIPGHYAAGMYVGFTVTGS